MNKIFLLPFFVLFVARGFSQTTVSSASPGNNNHVKTAAGIVQGSIDKHGIRSFKGIPFAAPPIGSLRWKAPMPAQPWSGVKQCVAFGPSPMQGTPNPFGPWTAPYLIPKESISEDCLYLNVWTGPAPSTTKKPVLVWIYGGGFGSGGSGVPIYDGTAMAQKGIVFVSINYRVGIFGFLAHPELSKESGRNASGNYGLLDQVAALQWVRENIAAFGGDPANVTIAGQSAGSMSVNCLVASPLAKGLFTKAIAESGAMVLSNSLRGNSTLQKAEENGEKFVRSFSVESIDAMRKIPAEDLLKKGGFQGGPIVDGYLLPEPVSKIFAAAKQNDVILLTGWNEDDGVLFGQPKTAAEFQAQIKQEDPKNADEILKRYPATNDTQAAVSQAKISRDRIFGVQNYTWANLQDEQGRKVYVYRFARKVPATGEYVKYGAFHTGEVPYAYDNLQFSDRPSTVKDEQLAKLMSGYWVNFITTGDPNAKGLPMWPAYRSTSKEIMIFDEQSKAQALPDAAALDVLVRTMNK